MPMGTAMPTSPHQWRASAHAETHPMQTRRGEPSERGVSLVEIIIVVAIIAILMAVVVSMHGPKRTVNFKAAQGAAQTYGDAVEAFMADNGQTPPVVNSAAWPTDVTKGPVDAMQKNKRYMRSVPEPVSDKRVQFVAGPMPAGSAITGTAAVAYTVAKTPSGVKWYLHVRTHQASGEPALECVVTNAPGATHGLGGVSVNTC